MLSKLKARCGMKTFFREYAVFQCRDAGYFEIDDGIEDS